MKILESILKKCGYTRTKRINKHNLFDSEKNYLLYNFYDIIKKMDWNGSIDFIKNPSGYSNAM